MRDTDYEAMKAAFRAALRAERENPDAEIRRPALERAEPRTEWNSGTYWLRVGADGERVFFNAPDTATAMSSAAVFASSILPKRSPVQELLAEGLRQRYGADVKMNEPTVQYGFGEDLIGEIK